MLTRVIGVLIIIAAGFLIFSSDQGGEIVMSSERVAAQIGREFKTAVFGVANWITSIIGV